MFLMYPDIREYSYQPLPSLIPPSYIVVPNRELVNKSFLNSSIYTICYESMLKGLSKEATLVLSNTRELNRVPSTK